MAFNAEIEKRIRGAVIPDAALVIDNFKTGRVPGIFEDEIVGFPFKYTVV
jgi:hypothetical protein